MTEDEEGKLAEAVRANTSVHSHTVMEWFALPSSGKSTKEVIDQRLNVERDSWDNGNDPHGNMGSVPRFLHSLLYENP